MKKHIDVSQVASSLRGESVFFPTKNEQPAPEGAGEPVENGDRAPKHQVTKAEKHQSTLAPQLQSFIAPSNQISKETKHQSTARPSNLSAKAPSHQVTKALKHFSSYLEPEVYKAWKLLATQREAKDYEILQEALEQYLEREELKT